MMAHERRKCVDIFSKIEATLNRDWIRNSGKDVTEILSRIENDFQVTDIQFKGGAHIISCTLAQLEGISRLFSSMVQETKKERSPHPEISSTSANRFSPAFRKHGEDERTFYNTNNRDLLSKGEPTRYPEVGRPDWRIDSQICDVPHSSGWQDAPKFRSVKEKDYESDEDLQAAGDSEDNKELMVDNDIWDFIEKKKGSMLKDAEAMYEAKISRMEDDSGVTKIVINPIAGKRSGDMLALMHDTLTQLYLATFSSNIIETTEDRLNQDDAQLVMDQVEETFPEVLTKHCIYNDSYLFIGPSSDARKAKQLFQMLARRIHSGEIQGATGSMDRLGRETVWRDEGATGFNPDQSRFGGRRPEHVDRHLEPASLPASSYAGRSKNAIYNREDEFCGIHDPRYKSEVSTNSLGEVHGEPAHEEREEDERTVGTHELKIKFSDEDEVKPGSVGPDEDGGQRWSNEFGKREEDSKQGVIDKEIDEKFQIRKTDKNDGREEDLKVNADVVLKENRVVNDKACDKDNLNEKMLEKPKRMTKIDAHGINVDMGLIDERKGGKSGSSTDEEAEKNKKSPASKAKLLDSKGSQKPRVKIIKKELPCVDNAASKKETEISRSGNKDDEVACVRSSKPLDKFSNTGNELSAGPKLKGKINKAKRERMAYDSAESDDEDSDFFKGNGSTPEKPQEQSEMAKKQDKSESREERIEKLMECNDEASQELLAELLLEPGDKKEDRNVEVQEEKKIIFEDVKDPSIKVEDSSFDVKDPSVEVTDDTSESKNSTSRPPHLKENAIVQPSGGVLGSVIDSDYHLEGFEKYGCIEITVHFPTGSQTADMQDPDSEYIGLKLKAFLPASSDGREALRLMKTAFNERKLFRIKKRLLENENDSIVSNGVDFKTATDGDNGFPDPDYLKKVLDQLKELMEIDRT